LEKADSKMAWISNPRPVDQVIFFQGAKREANVCLIEKNRHRKRESFNGLKDFFGFSINCH